MLNPYSFHAIAHSFNHSADAQPLLFRYVVRPISFVLTYGALRVHVSANLATVLGLLVGTLGAALFMVGAQPFVVWGVVCYALFLVLDFVDGNIARVTNTATYWGKFLDGAVDTIVETLLPLAMSIGFFRTTGSAAFLFAGIAVSTLLLYSSFLFTRLSFFNRWMDAELRDRTALDRTHQELNPLKTTRFPVTRVANITTDLKIIGVVLIAVWGLAPALLAFILAVIAIHTIPLIAVPLLDAAHHLNVHRVSKWDPRAQQ